MTIRKTLPFLAALFIFLCIVFGVLYSRADITPPVINFPEDEIVYTGDDSVLLQGVTAIDKKGGDVSYSLIVNSVSKKEDQQSVLVTYAAKDQKQNITCVRRELRYEPIVETSEDVDSEEDDDNDDEDVKENIYVSSRNYGNVINTKK